MGLAAGPANLPMELRTPPSSETSEMKRIYGKVIWARATVRLNFSGASTKPGAKSGIIHGMKTMKMALMTSSTMSNTAMTSPAKRRASARPFSVRILEKLGIKAALNAPSAKMRRKKLGSLNATKNASESQLAPIRFAMRISRTKPLIRERNVKKPMVSVDLTSDMRRMVIRVG